MLKAARLVFVVLLFISVNSLAQTGAAAASKGNHSAVPTVTFTVDWPEAEPSYYVLTIEASGAAVYESTGGKAVVGQPSLKFNVSEGTRSRVFDTAKALDYFNRDFEYKKSKIAFTGKKTIAYSDGERKFEATYNWSDNSSLRKLTELLQSISTTLEFGRSLNYRRRYDKLGLNEELKRMDELAAGGHLAELQVLSADLVQIAGDSSVMEIARQKARKLLQRANAGSSGSGSQAKAQR